MVKRALALMELIDNAKAGMLRSVMDSHANDDHSDLSAAEFESDQASTATDRVNGEDAKATADKAPAEMAETGENGEDAKTTAEEAPAEMAETGENGDDTKTTAEKAPTEMAETGGNGEGTKTTAEEAPAEMAETGENDMSNAREGSNEGTGAVQVNAKQGDESEALIPDNAPAVVNGNNDGNGSKAQASTAANVSKDQDSTGATAEVDDGQVEPMETRQASGGD